MKRMSTLRDSWLWLLLALFAQALFGTFPALADPTSVITDLERAYVHLADKVIPAVVLVQATTGRGSGPFLRESVPAQGRERSVRGSTGSGFFVSTDGHIMTNFHVVEGMDEISVILADKGEYKATVKGVDRDTDIALLKIEAKGMPFLKWGDSSKLRAGSIVVAVGNPLELSWSVTSGIVSATGRTGEGLATLSDFIQTNALINPGNSGGPLVNIRGEVVGITNAIHRHGVGLSFAVPSNTAKFVMDELLKHDTVNRGYLGIDDLNDLTKIVAMSLGLPDRKGTLVTSVVAGSPAARAGIKVGDVIVSYNGKPVEDSAHLKILVGQAKPGTSANLKLFREGRTVEVNATFVEHAAQSQSLSRPAK